jgi:hypothetical protein
MKLFEIFNNRPKLYFNVVPQKNSYYTGKFIAATMRAKADEEGNAKNQFDDATILFPNSKYDRRQYDDVAKSIVQKSRKILKSRRPQPSEFELVTNKHREARDQVGSGIMFR